MRKPTDEEIDDALNQASEHLDLGLMHQGTYEDGVIAAIEWMRGDRKEMPFSEDGS